MEIRDVVLRDRRRVLLLLAIGIVAAVVAGGLTYSGTREFRSRATFVAPSQNRESPTAIEQAVANLRANITTDPVVQAAAEAGGLSPGTVRDGLSLARRGASDTVELTFTTPRRESAQEVVQAAAEAVIAEVMGPDIDRARERVEAAEEEVTTAQDELDEFLLESDLTLPDEQFRAVAAELTSLRVALATAQVDGSARVDGLQAAVDDKEAELADLAVAVRAANQIEDDLDAANRRLDSAQNASNQLDAFLAIVDPANLDVSDARALPRGTPALRSAVAAGAVAIVTAILLLVLLELRGAARRPARATAAAAVVEEERPYDHDVDEPAAAAAARHARGSDDVEADREPAPRAPFAMPPPAAPSDWPGDLPTGGPALAGNGTDADEPAGDRPPHA